MARRAASLLALVPALLLTTEAQADAPLRLDLVAPRAIRLDGIPREWPSPLKPVATVLQGSHPSENDLRASFALAYDDANLYLALDVTDDRLVRTASCSKTDDHASLVIAFPKAQGGHVTHEIALYPGDPGKFAGCVTSSSGAKIPGAKIVEAPKAGGYTFEASIPWSSFPEASRTRVGMRGAIRFHDNDGRGIRTVIATSKNAVAAELPALLTEPEQSLKEGLLRQGSLPDAPDYEFIADVAGDGMNERVLVHDKWLVVLGPHFREGKEYFFADLGASARAGQIPRFEVRRLTGNAKAEILLEKRIGSSKSHREMLEVLGFGPSEKLLSLFRHEIGITTPEGRIRNEVKLVPEGDKSAIELLPGNAIGYTAATYKEPIERSFESMLFPWGSVKSRRFGWNGQAFVKVREESQAAEVVAPPQIQQPAATAPRPPNPDELQERVYALYRKDRGVPNEKPRFDLAVDVAEDAKRERVLLHGRDLVVFGPSYRGGAGYTYLTLQQFADSKDILELQARDLTGDGKAEIIVRGVVNSRSGDGVSNIEREIFLVYRADGANLSRIFALETARSMGEKRVLGKLSLLPGPKGTTIEVAPGRAIGWDAQSYPFAQDEGPVGGIEPLLLPWSGKAAVSYRFDGSAFVR